MSNKRWKLYNIPFLNIHFLKNIKTLLGGILNHIDREDVEYRTHFKGQEIIISSKWTQDARLYINGVCKDRSIRRVSLRKTRILSTTLSIGSKKYFVEVFAKALLSIKLQLRINGKQIAGEVF